jgi:hypothetical protein
MGQTDIYKLRYPELDDLADITQIRTLAEDVDAAIGGGVPRTYSVLSTQDTLLANTPGPYGAPIAVTIPGERAQAYIATASFDVLHATSPPGYSYQFVGYLYLDGAGLTGFAKLKGDVGLGGAANATWIGVLPPGNHQFQMFVTSDAWAAWRIFSGQLSIVVTP